MVFPDSGATICLEGTDHLPLLQINLKDLIPCNKRVPAVGGSTLVCKGWLPVNFNIQGHRTIQPLYICNNVDRIYFSKAVCIAVKILPPNFPEPMSPPEKDHVSVVKNNETKRNPPPTRPETLPFEPISANIRKLK